MIKLKVLTALFILFGLSLPAFSIENNGDGKLVTIKRNGVIESYDYLAKDMSIRLSGYYFIYDNEDPIDYRIEIHKGETA